VAVDFTTLHQRVCTGAWQPGTEESDFELWLPTSTNQSRCVMGKRVKYIRRKRNARCFNGEEFDKRQIVDFCECTEADWECDYGYYRPNSYSACIPINKDFENTTSKLQQGPPENCTGFYEIPSGYRKITGDYCVGGVNKGPVRKPCPGAISSFFGSGHPTSGEATGSSRYMLYIVGLVLLILIIWKKEILIILCLDCFDSFKDKLKKKGEL
jgi:hypothetical protein